MEELNMTESKSINRRIVVAGWAGLGAAALIGSRLASAQDSTTTEDAADAAEESDRETQAAALYEVFLTSVATSLNAVDNATVDVAMRDGLKASVDQLLADGTISADFATEAKTSIDEAAVPISFLSRNADRWNQGGRSNRRGSGGRGGNSSGSDESVDGSTSDPAAESTPSI